MHKKTGCLITASLLVLAGCQGYAPPGDGEGSFERGKLEMSAPPEQIAHFNELDTDGNGTIDPSEARTDTDLLSTFGTLDKDSDRQLSLEEYLDGQ
ncbi:EF-hand domain-containing protein [Chromohalobacter nigrandesensis]|uniref:EF-hand domain-containing protein n=1 Tax=Chromohalobacter nigrandesensis TaxID=119863 RepID=UPI001FF6B994|nr:EF-hand domain-containing protein [Chromohalobacter nigrandesensis]MCK0745555.1 EF-hand domain-containing protein [Chromohalobacter nigrandesensis]